MGCDDQDEALPSELSSLRIIGLLSSESDLDINEVFTGTSQPIKVGIVDFHPDDLEGDRVERDYTWEVCFSVGAFTRFDCLDDTRKLTFSGHDPFIEIPTDAVTIFSLFPDIPDADPMDDESSEDSNMSLPEGFALGHSVSCTSDLGAACNETEACPDGLFCDEGRCTALPVTIPVPLIVRVTVDTPDGQSRTGARSINLRLAGSKNENPSVLSVDIRGQQVPLMQMENSTSPCASIGPFAVGLDRIPMSAIVDEARLEKVKYADGVECREDDEADDVYLSWYTTVGRLKNEAGSLEYADNEVNDLPSEVMSARLYLAIRDGRGGLAISCLDYELKGGSPE